MVKPQGDAGVPSPIPAQVGENSRGDKTTCWNECSKERTTWGTKAGEKERRGTSVDGMRVDGLPDYLKANWEAIKGQLLTGAYRPSPVKRVEIPKPGGRVRLLGIPIVLDCLIQQHYCRK